MRQIQTFSGLRLAAILAAMAALAAPSAAHAIGNGVLDGDVHPNVGLIAIEIGGDKRAHCSGSYAGTRRGDPGTGVFLTAGHCMNLPPDIAASQLWVTFDPNATYDGGTGVVTASGWHQASGAAFDPLTGHDQGNLKDYGVLLLAEPVAVAPVQLPAAGLLDALAAKGALRPGTVFDNVGYGVVPTFKGGPAQYAPPPGRMFSTSIFQGLTAAWLKLLINFDVRDGNGGVCNVDSGAPRFIHGTNTVVATTSGGDARCRAQSFGQRVDVADARAFLGQYLTLP